MSGHSETNPHFLPPQQHPPAPPHEVPRHHPRHGPNLRPPRRRRQNEIPPLITPTPHSPPPGPRQTQHPHPHHIPTPYIPPPPHHDPDTHFPLHPQLPHQYSTDPPTHPPPPHDHPPSSNVRMPHPRQTKPYTWLIGAFCALFWIAIFLGGLVVLIVYLIFRPRSPKFDISAASLNAAYLDMGYLLNADMTLLANFTNPSKKATVDFNYMVVNLYFGNTLVATTYVEPFKAMKAESAFRNVHLVSSQVWLPLRGSQQMSQEIEGNRLRFEVKGLLRTRSNLGSLFRYSYWLYGHCIIEVTGPPSGVLVGKKCTTTR